MDLSTLTAASPEVTLALKTGLRVTHFVGLVLGLGAATSLDLIILRFLAKGTVSSDHYHTVEFASKVVSAGLLLLWISGFGFLLHYGLFDPAKLGNQKIWAKMAIVAVLTLNGVFIHRSVLPILRRNIGRNLFDGLTSMQRGLLLASGVVSATSWYVPLLLGSVPQLNFVVPAWIILSVYAALLSVGIGVTQGIAQIVIPPTAQVPFAGTAIGITQGIAQIVIPPTAQVSFARTRYDDKAAWYLDRPVQQMKLTFRRASRSPEPATAHLRRA